MLHSELIKRIIEDFQDEFNENPANNDVQKSFREGLLFAYNYLLVLLENPQDIELSYPTKKEQ